MTRRRTHEPSTPVTEPWNQQALIDARRCDLPAYWILITPVEAQALADGVVSTRLIQQTRTHLLAPEPLQRT